MYLTRLRTYKQKPRRGGGLRQINTCRQVPLQFKKSRHLGLESISYLVRDAAYGLEDTDEDIDHTCITDPVSYIQINSHMPPSPHWI